MEFFGPFLDWFEMNASCRAFVNWRLVFSPCPGFHPCKTPAFWAKKLKTAIISFPNPVPIGIELPLQTCSAFGTALNTSIRLKIND